MSFQKRSATVKNAALTIPVSLSGNSRGSRTQQLAGTLVNFVSSHLELKITLDRAKADMAAAAKTAQVEARNKSKSQVEKGVINNMTATKPLAAEAPDEQKPKPAKTPSLFEAEQEPEPVPVAANAPPVVEQATGCQLSDEDQEIWAEINAEREYAEQNTDEYPD